MGAMEKRRAKKWGVEDVTPSLSIRKEEMDRAHGEPEYNGGSHLHVTAAAGRLSRNSAA
jgi:hypothetical protein